VTASQPRESSTLPTDTDGEGAEPGEPGGERSLPSVEHADSSTGFPAHRWGIGAFLLVEAVLLCSAAFVSAILAPAQGDGVSSASIVVFGSMLPTMIAAGAALLVTVLRGNGPKLDLRWSFCREDFRVGVKFGLIGLLSTTFAAWVWIRVVGDDNATSAVGALVGEHPLPVASAIMMFLYLWLIAPICEEIIFRGLLWGALERLQWGRWAVFALSTAVFAASHLEPLRTTLLIVIGIPIGLARLRTDRLGGSIVAHQVNNFLPAVATLLVALGVTSA
jgi:membrane protease YdiL (CAAX protease family)